jgi:uncharacterized membrane protein YphA (DoxX/SURF4 family)
MANFSKPLGNNSFAPLLIRATIGSYFLMAGLQKLDQIPAFVGQVQRFGILPNQLATLYGMLLPYVEIMTGFLMLIGLWTTLTGVLGSLMLFSFIVAFGVFPNGSQFFNKDIILFAGTLSLILTGPGAWGLDKIKK